MKFPGENGSVVTVRGKSSDARKCYQESLKITKSPSILPVTAKEKGKQKMERRDLMRDAGVMMTNLDPRADFEYQRPQPEGDQILVQIGLKEDQIVKIGANLPPVIKGRLIELLKTNKDLFAWVSSDMPEVDLEFVCYRLSLRSGSIPVAQKKRKMGPERQAAIEKQVKELLDAGFIREIRYADWLSNVVMVKKANGKWRMCTDYTDLNKACPKDPFPLPLSINWWTTLQVISIYLPWTLTPAITRSPCTLKIKRKRLLSPTWVFTATT